MKSVTIRLSLETKRELLRLAKAGRTTPGTVVERLLRRAREDALWRDVGDAYARRENRDLAETAKLVAGSSRRLFKKI